MKKYGNDIAGVAVEVANWLREREANCHRLRQGEPEEDQASWIEDAEFFTSAALLVEMLAAPDMVETLPNLPCLHVQGGDYRPHYRADEVHRYIAVCRERERIIRDSSSVEPSHCSGEIRPNDPVPESTRLATGLILKWQNQELSISAGDYDVIADDLAEFLKEYV